MASTAPSKSQPLHNFTLPQLKWNKDGSSSGQNQRRRSTKSPSSRPNTAAVATPTPLIPSPMRDSDPPPTARYPSPFRTVEVTAESSPNENPVRGNDSGKRLPVPEITAPYWMHLNHSSSSSSSSYAAAAANPPPRRDFAFESEFWRSRDATPPKSHSKTLPLESLRYVNVIHSPNSFQKTEKKIEINSKIAETPPKIAKILIKIPQINQEQIPLEDPPKTHAPPPPPPPPREVEEDTKIWNLRPRKPKLSPEIVQTASPKTQPATNNQKKKSVNVKGKDVKKEKNKTILNLTVPLTKEEIEEDIFALTGSKPARRPRKRAKNVQKQLDNVFPGLWLMSISPDSYKVSESSMKG